MDGPPQILSRYTPDSHALVGFWVPGKPRQQGSKRTFAIKNKDGYTGKVGMAEMAKGVQDWRADVKSFALREMHGKDMIVGAPAFMHLFFVLYRSTSIPKSKPTPPAIKKNGDLDKLIRAMGDAMTGIVYADDSLVTEEFSDKRTAELGEQPGCWVSVGPVLDLRGRQEESHQTLGG